MSRPRSKPQLKPQTSIVQSVHPVHPVNPMTHGLFLDRLFIKHCVKPVHLYFFVKPGYDYCQACAAGIVALDASGMEPEKFLRAYERNPGIYGCRILSDLSSVPSSELSALDRGWEDCQWWLNINRESYLLDLFAAARAASIRLTGC